MLLSFPLDICHTNIRTRTLCSLPSGIHILLEDTLFRYWSSLPEDTYHPLFALPCAAAQQRVTKCDLEANKPDSSESLANGPFRGTSLHTLTPRTALANPNWPNYKASVFVDSSLSAASTLLILLRLLLLPLLPVQERGTAFTTFLQCALSEFVETA